MMARAWAIDLPCCLASYSASLGLGFWLLQRLGVNGLWEAGDPAGHLRVWGTEVLTWELPYRSQGALQTSFPGSFSHWKDPPTLP